MKKKLYFFVRGDVGKALRRIYRLRKSSNLHLKKNTPLRKPPRTQKDNIKMGRQRTGCEIRAEGVF